MPAGVTAAGGILMYLDMTQHLQTGHIQHLSRIEEDKYVWLDRFTVRNLELTGGQREDSCTLFDIIDRTITPMGGRMLHRWMAFPLKEVRPIRNRQTVVEHLFRQPEARETIRESLEQVGDLERIVSKISTGRIGPREIGTTPTCRCWAKNSMRAPRCACVSSGRSIPTRLWHKADRTSLPAA